MKKVMARSCMVLHKTVTRKLGAWKWARTRYADRIIIVPRKLAEIGGCLDRRNPLVKVIWEGPDYTMDYPGGHYGYERADGLLRKAWEDITGTMLRSDPA